MNLIILKQLKPRPINEYISSIRVLMYKNKGRGLPCEINHWLETSSLRFCSNIANFDADSNGAILIYIYIVNGAQDRGMSISDSGCDVPHFGGLYLRSFLK